ncbi:zinc ribbon domain-containing protein [Dysgonomonas sp. ZJ279]|uniref:zinc ribbon domain-containing protein n=1 Tax=Dysgonomonas sp. ZJ279 TaxID=2709796 RepID=UPI0013EC6BA9|nr:zinc ribbon domain-containing protein [Dysgonomonas sp. ZJ279]
MNENVCQSCGIPMTAKEQLGTNGDGTSNADYCVYCYKDGNFTSEETMDEMIAASAEYPESLQDEKGNRITKEEFITNMKVYYPTLKRWKCN